MLPSKIGRKYIFATIGVRVDEINVIAVKIKCKNINWNIVCERILIWLKKVKFKYFQSFHNYEKMQKRIKEQSYRRKKIICFTQSPGFPIPFPWLFYKQRSLRNIFLQKA